MTSRGARTARGAAIAAFAVLAASLAHTVGGGAPPGPVAIALALAFATPIAMLLVGGRRSLLRASASALVAQLALHLLYALGAPVPGSGPSVDAHALHAGGSIALDGFVAVDHGHVGMPVAHIVAAMLTVAFLAVLGRAVDVVATVSTALTRGIRFLVAVLAGTRSPVRTAVPHPVVRRVGPPDLGILLLSSLRHRGPPFGVAAA